MSSAPVATAAAQERRQRLNPDGTLLNVTGLKTYFRTMDGVVKAVDGVDFSLKPGQTLGIVGESGCGKSVTSLSVMRLVDPPGWIAGGQMLFRGTDLATLSEKEMRRIRGDEISMIFQEPMTSLNPVFTVGNQVMEAIIEHRKVSKREALAQTVELLTADMNSLRTAVHEIGTAVHEMRTAVHEMRTVFKRAKGSRRIGSAYLPSTCPVWQTA